jgi:uncharacterized protein (TIGR00725 family)
MPEMRNRKRIAVIGGAKPEHRYYEMAYEVGRLLAEAGAIVFCGGLGGVMEAACRGAREAGGFTVSILPGNDPAAANPFVELPVATGIGYSRNSLVVMNADAVIAVDGSYGTLSEIAFGMIQGKMVVGLGTWDIKGVASAASPEEAVRLALQVPVKSTGQA